MSVFGFFTTGFGKGVNHERSELELNESSTARVDLWVLSPYVRAGLDDGVLFLGFGSLQKKITDRRRQELLLSTAHFWMTPSSSAEAEEYLVKRAGATESEAKETVSFLLENRYLIRPNAFRESERFSRHALFYALAGADPSVVQERLRQSHVVILGCGGIGNAVACTLATSGVGRLTLIDDDRIESSNLTRQFLFGEGDVGSSKATVLKRELEKRDSSVSVDVLEMTMSSEADFERLPDCQLIVASADSGGLLPRLNAVSVRRRIPYLDIGYVQDVAVWGPFVIPGRTGCHACRKLTATEPKPGDLAWSLIREINGRYRAPGFGAVNLLAASHGALDILRFLGEFGEIRSLNRRVGLWTHDLHFEAQDCLRNPDCPVCGKLTLN